MKTYSTGEVIARREVDGMDSEDWVPSNVAKLMTERRNYWLERAWLAERQLGQLREALEMCVDILDEGSPDEARAALKESEDDQ